MLMAADNLHLLSCKLRILSDLTANSCRRASCLDSRSNRATRTRDCHIQQGHSQFLKTEIRLDQEAQILKDGLSLTLTDCTKKVIVDLFD